MVTLSQNEMLSIHGGKINWVYVIIGVVIGGISAATFGVPFFVGCILGGVLTLGYELFHYFNEQGD
ncbi:class IIb bacteriocin, lactobin A/cerein 7B family [Staphylococcus massiliensis]|uniref:class IIb bacteriocin, lactobin A/cerein 7B family n=1 Tax=Staphylococcus massiliensis TaxID=555791 RepID=UPI001EDD9E8E|nr:class IIb bacteriocin, lactobin A/cerein 7B family [Staphylococcus massiliensis]MCG3413276.1 class IIb bacteriocin, lactobin A/cerein 7B family [Staphylococcus massiliensis]